jgi:hypothetical protein
MSAPAFRSILDKVWGSPLPGTPIGSAALEPADVDALSASECSELANEILQGVRARLQSVSADQVSPDLSQRLLEVKQLVQAEEREDVDFPTLVARFRRACGELKSGGGPSAATFDAVDRAFAVFVRVQGRADCVGEDAPPSGESAAEGRSRSTSDSHVIKTPSSEEELAPTTAEEFGTIPPELISAPAFVDRLVGEMAQCDCVVLGDGSHQDSALSQILSTPGLVLHLKTNGLTHVVLEHVYPHHIELMRVAPERGVALLRQHLKRCTFPVPESLESRPGAPDEERRRKETLAAIQKQQVDTYVDFITFCINTPGMCVVAMDSPQLYVQRDRSAEGRIKALNVHVTSLVEDIREVPSAKMLVIVGAAHTNSKNSAAAAGAPTGPGQAHTAGIVQRLRKRDSHFKVGEMVFVSASSVGLHTQLASIKKPVYLIKP